MHIISSIQFCISSISWCFRQTYNHLWCCSTPFMDFISHVPVDLPVDIKRASLIREVNHERDYVGIRITLSYFAKVCHEIAKLACNPNSPSHSRPSRRWYFLHSEKLQHQTLKRKHTKCLCHTNSVCKVWDTYTAVCRCRRLLWKY